MGVSGGGGRGWWFPAFVSSAGVASVYFLWVFGHPYLALAAALLGSIVSINHYLLSKHAGPVVPYWVFFLSLMAALGVYAVFKDLFGGLVAAYVFVLGFIIAFPAPSLLREVLGGVFGSDDRVASVVGAAAVAGLAYLYIYGVDADLIGLWVMAGPLAEFFLVRQAVVLGGGDSLPDLGVHAYSVAASLTFLPHPLLGAYAVLANSVKGVVRGRHAFVAVVADYLVRVLLLVYLNLGRIPVPVSEGLGW